MIVVDSILNIEQYLNDVDAVIFDLDDTLYSEKEYVRSGYQKISEYFNRPEFEEQLWNVFKNGGKAIDEVFRENGLSERKDEALRIYRHQEPNIHLYVGVAELIDRLRLTKKVGIITDGRPEGQWAKIRALGLDVDEIIVTDELGGVEYRKPNETAFILMQKQMNIEFGKMVYVGDNIKKDFIAPDKLGMKSIWYKCPDGIYC